MDKYLAVCQAHCPYKRVQNTKKMTASRWMKKKMQYLSFPCQLVTPVRKWSVMSRTLANTSFTTGLKTLPSFRPDALVFFRAKMIFALKNTRASGRNDGKVFNPVVKLVLENQPFLTPEPAEKPSLQNSCYCNKWPDSKPP